MYYNYTTSEGHIRTFISFESYNDNVSIYANKSGKEIESKLYNNTEGELVFDYKGNEVPFLSFIKLTMADIKKGIELGEFVTDDQLINAIICDGVENIRFGIDMPIPTMCVPIMGIMIYGDEKRPFTCKVKSKSRYQPHHNYKVEVCVVSEEDPDGIIASRSYYTSDMMSLIKCGAIKILDSKDDGKTPDERVREYFANASKGEYFDYHVPAYVNV